MVSYAGEVKLIDFGTARGHNRRCHTVAGVVFAKPGYVAPEVARQQVGDGRIDLYALGIMLWELVRRAPLPQRTTRSSTSTTRRPGKVTVPAIAASCGAPAELDDVIAQLTSNDPDERYARAGLAVADLAKLLSSAPSVEGRERGVRARISCLMRTLWPHEPARSRTRVRAPAARGTRSARRRRPAPTPAAGPVSEALAMRMTPPDPLASRRERPIASGASSARARAASCTRPSTSSSGASWP